MSTAAIEEIVTDNTHSNTVLIERPETEEKPAFKTSISPVIMRDTKSPTKLIITKYLANGSRWIATEVSLMRNNDLNCIRPVTSDEALGIISNNPDLPKFA
ncbi:MAG: hypothetical protein GY804_04995 [Alphaproteobacteria bacterium]|nr:hypothetical protein [Alphaproteobacteria bacterium]